jgi:hypothetical protein
LKFLSTIRLDVSDENVFPLAAKIDEWALTGTFIFSDINPVSLSKKEMLAFRNGWLGTKSFGHSTFVLIKEISEKQYQSVVSSLAEHIFKYYGAPDMDLAMKAARGEVEFAAELCDHPIGTMLSIERAFTDNDISESFRVVEKQKEKTHTKIWSIVDE